MNGQKKANGWSAVVGLVLLGAAAAMTGIVWAQDTPAGGTSTGPEAEKSQEDVLEELLKDSAPEPMIINRFGSDEASSTTVAAVDPKARFPLTVREGDVLINRLGRLDRDAMGQPLFVYEADGQSLSEPPLILLPCHNLEIMEGLAKKMPGTKMVVTGEITVYHGRGYLLLRKVMLQRDLGQF